MCFLLGEIHKRFCQTNIKSVFVRKPDYEEDIIRERATVAILLH